MACLVPLAAITLTMPTRFFLHCIAVVVNRVWRDVFTIARFIALCFMQLLHYLNGFPGSRVISSTKLEIHWHTLNSKNNSFKNSTTKRRFNSNTEIWEIEQPWTKGNLKKKVERTWLYKKTYKSDKYIFKRVPPKARI